MSRLALAVLCLGLLGTGCSKNPQAACTSDSQCTVGRCCSGKCVDVLSSASHCGACSNPCSTQNGAAQCIAGACAISCSSGWGDCNALAEDGCETELARTAAHCGACGKACSAPNALLICERRLCLQSSCKPGFGDCNGDETDGCEADLKQTLANCGGCGKKCEVANGVGECTQSFCIVASCNAGFGDCDLSPAGGCETQLKVSDLHCGGCGMACSAGTRCKDGKCVAPELLFYGGALSLQSALATNQVSAFNLETHSWSSVATAGAESPGSRMGHVAVWDAAASRMLVWGGYLSGNTPADTALYALELGTGSDGGASATWKKLVTTGGPAQHRGMTGWAWDKASRNLFIYGGTDNTNNVVYDELWQLDVPTLTWRRRTEPGSPGPRYLPSMVWDSESQRVLVGQGFDDNWETTTGFHAFDPAADGGNWSVLAATGTPVSRAAAPFLGDTQPLQMWAGLDNLGDPLTDLYRLEPLDGGAAWTPLQPANPPGARGYPLAVSTAERRFIFGGFVPQGYTTVAVSEVWELTADAGWELVADGGINFVHPGALFGSAIARE